MKLKHRFIVHCRQACDKPDLFPSTCFTDFCKPRNQNEEILSNRMICIKTDEKTKNKKKQTCQVINCDIFVYLI